MTTRILLSVLTIVLIHQKVNCSETPRTDPKCVAPGSPRMTNVNLTDLVGKWYEVERSYPSLEYRETCNVFNFYGVGKSAAGPTILFVEEGQRSFDGKTFEFGIVQAPEFKLVYGSEMPLSMEDMSIFILDFMKDKYMVIYACREDNFGEGYRFTSEYAFILSRIEHLPSEEMIDLKLRVSELTNLDAKKIYRIRRRHCPRKTYFDQMKEEQKRSREWEENTEDIEDVDYPRN